MDNSDISEFQQSRSKYQPQVPQLFNLPELKTVAHQVDVLPEIRKLFPNLCKSDKLDAISFEPADAHDEQISAPLRIGCVLSGGQAAGGHNVIVGIYEQLKRRHPNSQLFGFLKGPIGIYTGKYIELKDDVINFFKNRGGFDMIQSGRHKIETEEQFAKSLQYCQSLKLDGLVVIGGDDSNTNACLLAEYFLKNGCTTSVIGCPKTIDGDLKNEYVEVSFGFDTACKTYSELIGNIMLDTVSSKKYYHFIRLMGRSASHITLECALTTKPNWAFIGEEIEQSKQSLESIINELVDLIIKRAEQGKEYGVILVPEGLIEFIDEIKNLITEINTILSKNHTQIQQDQLYEFVKHQLQYKNQMLLDFLPKVISQQLLLDRDPHGNVQVAKIETEKLLVSMIEMELEQRKNQGQIVPQFKTICHYFGYEGRCAFPSNFDCDYCYSLGMNAALLIEARQTGLMSVIRNLDQSPQQWQAGGYPLVTMMDVERRKGKYVPVIKKALTELKGDLFAIYKKYRSIWAFDDHYQSPGPIQFYFKCSTPYLVKAPTNLQLNLYPNDLDYTKDGMPYEQVQKKNMSSLAQVRSQNKTQLPLHLNLNLVPNIIEDTQYSQQVLKSIQKHFPQLLTVSKNAIQFLPQNQTSQQQLQQSNKKSLKLGICMNGRQSPGGNVIIQGLLEFAEQTNSTLYGFVGGTKGLFENKTINLSQENIKYYVNQGGYHLLGRTADKVRSPSELEALKKTCLALDLDGLVLVGASHTLTDTLTVSNYLINQNVKTRAVAVPCTLDNNIYHPMLEGVVGFDTAAKTYSQLIGNIMIDAASAVKYWYFIRLMGRDPSHLVLECALQTHPNVVLISEDIEQRGLTLQDIVNEVADIIVLRSENNKEFGTVLIPEGLLLHIGQFKQLINELNKLYASLPDDKNLQEQVHQQLLFDEAHIRQQLTPWSAALFLDLPAFTRKQLVLEREVNGGVQLSMIETERLISQLVSEELERRKQQKKYKGSFSPVCHFFGYQGRCAFPTLFDCNLAFSYGYLAGLIILNGKTGYCVSARGITGPINKWHYAAIPILNMTNLKIKSAFGENVPVVSSYNVDTKKAPFQKLQALISEWWLTDHYENPGPTQFFGPLAGKTNITLELTLKNYVDQIEQIENISSEITELCRYETKENLLEIAIDQLKTVLKTVQVLKKQT